MPILKDARSKGHEAVLVEDKLFIDKKRFIPGPSFRLPPPPTHSKPHQQNIPPNAQQTDPAQQASGQSDDMDTTVPKK